MSNGCVARVQGDGDFLSSAAPSEKSFAGTVLWVGGKADSDKLRPYTEVELIECCTTETFIETYRTSTCVTAVVFVDLSGNEIRELSGKARRFVYSEGITVPVYAATTDDIDAWRYCDVVEPKGKVFDLCESMCRKLEKRTPGKKVLWCDPAAKSPSMVRLARKLAKLGLEVLFFEDAAAFSQKACEVCDDLAAVVTSGRGIPKFPEIRKKLHQRKNRPLFWVVSTTAQSGPCYEAGADGAIVKDNSDLQFHQDRLTRIGGGDPWMWQIVVGDLLAIIQAVGVSQGYTQWSMPKLYDDPTWRRENFKRIESRAQKVFSQVAQSASREVVSFFTNIDHMPKHEMNFHKAASALKGYVRDRVLYHGTSPEIARKIMDTNFIPSLEGMYGPGVYGVDPKGLAKALWFAMRSVNSTGGVRKVGAERTEGAIVAFRVALCNSEVVTSVKWWKKDSPCAEDQDSVLGVASQGYPTNTLNDIPEYVIRNPLLCVPIGMAIFK